VINVRIRTFFIQIRTYEFIQQAARAKPEPRARSASRECAARAARAKPEHTSCPDQAAPGCPDVRVHPAAPTFRVHPAAPTLGYTRLPRPVRVRSWGGWVRNGIKITISKMRLYKFIGVTYSQPHNRVVCRKALPHYVLIFLCRHREMYYYFIHLLRFHFLS
jgi:hypothetical protein